MLVKIPYSRIHTHRQYAAPNQQGFTVTVRPYFGGVAGPIAAGRADAACVPPVFTGRRRGTSVA